jgi:hypothetical protein
MKLRPLIPVDIYDQLEPVHTLLPCDNWISHDNININKQEKQPTKI